MSRTTVHYIQMPKIKSSLTSCRRAKARCQPVAPHMKVKVREWNLAPTRRPAAPPQKENRVAPQSLGQTTPPK